LRGGVPYTFWTNTSDTDPGNGVLKLNSVTYTGVTKIFVDNVSATGWLATGWYATFDDSTSTVKGYITLLRADADGAHLVYQVNSVEAATGYYRINVNYVSGSFVGISANSTPIVMQFSRTGDKGETGATGPAGATGSQGPKGDAGDAYGNIDGGKANSVFGGTLSVINGGSAGSF